ncbi:MAG TPA: GNAT family N-acetyltransferase [Ignavibacteria bacterium]|nr:GNAT family N-acetyltransferase [Ignavibacteria bacterium]
MENYLIRKIMQEDNDNLKSIIKQVFEELNSPREGTVYSDPTTNDLFNLFSEKRSVLWVAEENEEIFGCCGVYPTKGLDKDCAELVKFYLSSNARGKGIGKALMQQSIQSAKDLGFKKLYLESLPEFSKAVCMYERSGFERLDKPMGSSGHGSCNIWMIKEL